MRLKIKGEPEDTTYFSLVQCGNEVHLYDETSKLCIIGLRPSPDGEGVEIFRFEGVDDDKYITDVEGRVKVVNE